jgi:hypothetical protein
MAFFDFGLFAHRPYLPAYTQSDYDQAMERLQDAKRPNERYYALADAALTSLFFASDVQAEELARELLEARSRVDSFWNHGNAEHDANVVLGMVALRGGDRALAAEHLRRAGDTPGSPQLDTFGPKMLLARALLEQGQREPVLDYFERCKRFWRMDRGRLDAWSSDVREGRMPDFGASLL